MDELLNRLATSLTNLPAEERTEFIRLIRPAVGLKETLADDSTIGVGQSKIGGRPDLPIGTDWPTFPEWNNEPLTFCAQYNLAEAAPFDLERLLPKQGLLSVFIYIDQNCPCFFNWPGSFRILYSEDVTRLTRTDFPPNYFQGGIFRAARIAFFQYYTTPAVDGYKIRRFDTNRMTAFRMFGGAVEEIADSLSGLHVPDLPQFPTHNYHQLLGEDRPIQASVLYDFAREILATTSDGEARLQVSQTEREAVERQYIILLQIDTASSKANDLDKYGGTGVIYFGIKPEDLRNKRFDGVVMTFQDT